MITTYDGAHSIKIGLDPVSTGRYRHTWKDWCLVPTSRPFVVRPEVNETWMEIPGMNGQYDLTDKLHNYPTYGLREGSWEFHVAHDVAALKFGVPEEMAWNRVVDAIANYLHGQGLRCILDDDPRWYYDGRFKINQYKSNKYYSTITIDYKLQPYKWDVLTTANPNWAWDPFEFVTDTAMPTTIIYNDDTKEYTKTTNDNPFVDFSFPPKAEIDKAEAITDPEEKKTALDKLYNKFWPISPNGSWNMPQRYFGSAPVCPEFWFEPANGCDQAVLRIDNSCTGVFTPLATKPGNWLEAGLYDGWRQYYENRGYHYIMLNNLYDTAPPFVPNKFFNRDGTSDDEHVLVAGCNVLPDVEFICPTADDWVRVLLKGKGKVTINFRRGRL